jgi:hypothetical protein
LNKIIFRRGKSSLKFGYICNGKKLPNVNSNPIGKNSPNRVALLAHNWLSGSHNFHYAEAKKMFHCPFFAAQIFNFFSPKKSTEGVDVVKRVGL